LRRSGEFTRTVSSAASFDSVHLRLLPPDPWRLDCGCGKYVSTHGRSKMSLGMILLIIVILLLVGAIPSWPHSRSWGYAPSGGLGLVLVIIIILVVLGRI
jgi:Protein of unknown function (DUF3309)